MSSGKKRAQVIKIALLATSVAALLAMSRFYDIRGLLESLLDRIAGSGMSGVVAFGLLYIAATVFFIPGSLLTLGAGAIYGVAYGTALVSVSSTLGATAAFLIGRYLARGWVAQRIGNNPRFVAIDDAVGREGWKIVGLTRLSPFFPFNLLNYAFGLTRVGLLHYLIASWIGMLPGTLMYVYFGSIAGDLATIGEGGSRRGPLEWTLYGAGLIATVALTILITRIARRALRRRVPHNEGNT